MASFSQSSRFLVLVLTGTLAACGGRGTDTSDPPDEEPGADVVATASAPESPAVGKIVRQGSDLVVTANDWSRFSQTTYEFFDVDAYVLRGEGRLNVATRHPVVVDGEPKAPDVYIGATDLAAFTDGPNGPAGAAGWYVDASGGYTVASVTELDAVYEEDVSAYWDLYWQIMAYPNDADVLQNFDARMARLDEVGSAGVDAAKLAALQIREQHFAYDASLVQHGIDLARPGDTVVLSATRPFYFGGATVASRDQAGKITNGVPVALARGTASLATNFGWTNNYGSDSAGNVLGWDRVILVNKPITVTGELASGERTTLKALGPWPDVTTFSVSCLGCAEPIHASGNRGHQGKFVLASAGARLQGLRLEGFALPIISFTPGVVIANNTVVDTIFGIALMPDTNLVYPNLPSLDGAVSTQVIGNRITGSGHSYQSIRVMGSEVTVSDNVIDTYGVRAIHVRVAPPDADWAGGLLDLTRVDNTRVVGNTLQPGAEPLYSTQAAIGTLHAGGGGEIVGTVIEGNSVRVIGNDGEPSAYQRGVVVYAGAEDVPEGTVIRNNYFEGLAYPIRIQNGAGGEIAGNVFVGVGGNGRAAVLLSDATGYSVGGNDYTRMWRWGWDDGTLGVLLGSQSAANVVEESRFPAGASVCTLILDETVSAENPDGLNSILGAWALDCRPELTCSPGDCVTEHLVWANSAGWIAVDSSSVYWTEWHTETWTGSVMKAPLGGGVPTTLATTDGPPIGLAVRSGIVVWVENYPRNVVATVSADGGPVNEIAAPWNTPWSMTADDTYVYWVESNCLVRMPLGGGLGETLYVSSTWAMSQIAIADGAFYFTDNGSAGRTLYRFAPETGELLALTGNLGQVQYLVADATSVYWSQFDGAVLKVPVTGGDATMLVRHSESPSSGLALDGASLYAKRDAPMSVLRVGVDGGSPLILATSNWYGQPASIAIEGPYVYWTTPDSIYRTTK